jgi:hypothetical protein
VTVQVFAYTADNLVIARSCTRPVAPPNHALGRAIADRGR